MYVKPLYYACSMSLVYSYRIDVSNCYQVIKRVVEGIATANGEGGLAQGDGDLRHLMWIKNAPVKKLSTNTRPVSIQTPCSNQTPY